MTVTESDDLATAFLRNGAALVIESMLNSDVMNGRSAEDRIAAVMLSLEEMAEFRTDEACCLMLRLWPLASELMMHNVCDGIDLWITNNRSPRVFANLGQLAKTEVDPNLKSHFEGLRSVKVNA